MSSKKRTYHKSKFKFVTGMEIERKLLWYVRFKSVTGIGYTTERAAAVAVDIALLKQGKKAINILVKKNN